MQIAVCDDEKEIRDMFAEKIERLYPEAGLLLYQSGEELLLSDKEPDILLLDIQMPGKNGMETAKALRRKNKKVIFIFVTALDDFVFQAFDVKAFHYLIKPFDDEKFVEILLNAVKQFEDRKKLERAGGKSGRRIFPHSQVVSNSTDSAENLLSKVRITIGKTTNYSWIKMP